MGTNFSICDCKNRDLSTESNIQQIKIQEIKQNNFLNQFIPKIYRLIQ